MLLIPKIHFFLKVETICFYTVFGGTLRPLLTEQHLLESVFERNRKW